MWEIRRASDQKVIYTHEHLEIDNTKTIVVKGSMPKQIIRRDPHKLKIQRVMFDGMEEGVKHLYALKGSKLGFASLHFSKDGAYTSHLKQ